MYAVKLSPAGATTNSASGVTDIRKTYPTLREMARLGMPLLIHGEVTDPAVDIFDRERVFLSRVLEPLIKVRFSCSLPPRGLTAAVAAGRTSLI